MAISADIVLTLGSGDKCAVLPCSNWNSSRAGRLRI